MGIASFYYLGIYHIKDTNYDHDEEGAVIPNHILEGKGLTEGQNVMHIQEGNSSSEDRYSRQNEKVTVSGHGA